MKTFLRKTLVTAAVAAGLGFASVPAMATFADFTVDETSVPGNEVTGLLTSPFEADKINGAYSERISFDGSGNFAAKAVASFSQYLANEGAIPVDSFVGTPNALNIGYNLYALFDATGTVAGNTFTGSTSSFTLWIDPSEDTTFALPATAAGAVTVNNGGDDFQIAFANNLTFGQGILNGITNAFDLFFDDFTLTAAGALYFTSPNPFHILLNVDGDFENFAFTGNQTVTGDLSAVFLVPEPGTLALLGIGLIGLGLGFGRQRRSA